MKRIFATLIIGVLAPVMFFSAALAETRLDAVIKALDQFDQSDAADGQGHGWVEEEMVVKQSVRTERMQRALQTAERAVSQNPRAVCWAEVCTVNSDGKVRPDVVLSVEDVYDFQPAQTSRKSAERVKAGDPGLRKESKTRESYSFYDDWVDLRNERNSLEVGAEWFDYTYREEGFMKLDGSMKGLYLTYAHRFRESRPVETWKDVWNAPERFNLIRLETRYSYGDDIHYRSNGTGEAFDEKHYTWETRAILGYDVPLKDDILVTPYLGFAYRYLLDDNGGGTTTTGNWTYDRESRYYYVPIGFDITRRFKDDWSIGFNFEYDIFWDGEQTSHFEDGPAGSNYDTCVNKQDQGYGLRGSVKMVKEQEKFDFVIEPFARYWHIKDSLITFLTRGGVHIPGDDPGTYKVGLEPNNRTWEFGVRAGVRF